MTGQPSQQRKPPDWPNGGTPYASLHPVDAAASQTKSAPGVERNKEAVINDFDAEADKLKALREALWAAFEAGPSAGLPNTLIDLTMAYTGALRLQLNLRAVSARQVKPQSRALPTQRSDANAQS